jgi:hypothetical protein
MNRNCCLWLLLLAPVLFAHGQCNMSLEVFTNVNCSVAQVSVATIGGTAPYDILVETLNTGGSQVVEDVVNDADGYLSVSDNTYGPTWPWSYAVRVTVTDAVNCEATMEVPHNTPYFLNAQVGNPYFNCATGTYQLRMHFSPPDLPQSFSVDGGPVMPFDLNTWLSIPGSQDLRLNMAIAPGTHGITFPAFGPYCPVSFLFSIPPGGSPGDCGVNFRLRAALDGALPSGTIMTDGLRAANLIPATQPYTALGYAFIGSPTNVSIPAALLAVTGNDAIADWVVVEVRGSTAPYPVLYSKPALLQRDGDVIDTDGDAYIACSLAAGSYRLALRHRNHLGVMTGGAYLLSVDPANVTVNFRSTNTGTYGTSARVLKGSVQCLWAGDATGDGSLKYGGSGNDRDPILLSVGSTTPNATVSNVYDRRDTNLDGVIKYTGTGNDRDIILTNVGGTTPNNTRTAQLP